MKKCILLLFLFAFGIFPTAFSQSPPALTVDFVPFGAGPFWYGETISFNYEWKLNGTIAPLP